MAGKPIDSRALTELQQRVERIPPTALPRELEKCLNALRKRQKDVGLNYASGLMAMRLGDFPGAASHLSRALKLSRDNPVVLGTLAFLYAHHIADHHSAVELLKRKLRTAPGDVAAGLLMANSLMNLGKPQDALDAINRAEPHASGTIRNRLHAMRSQCHQRMGNFEEAREELLKLAELDPLGLISVADVLSRMPGNPDELAEKLESEMQAALKDGPSRFRNSFHQAMTAIAVANILESRGDHGSAFECFEQANQLQERDPNAWSHQETQEFAIYKSVFDKKLFEKLPRGHGSEKQIFIVGMPRSGTTLLESILSGHDDVEDHGELDFFIIQNHRLGFTAEKNPDAEKASAKIRHLLLSAPANGLQELAENYRKRYGFDRKPALSHVDKMPHNFRCLGLIAASFPNAKIIHVRRHPMDVCLSNYKNLLPGYNTTFGRNLETLGRFYVEYASLMRHWQSVLPSEILEVRYEKLVSDTEAEAQRLIEFCGLEWQPEVLGKRLKKTDANTASMWQVRQDIYKSSVMKWEAYRDQLEPLRIILEDEIARYEAL